MSYRDMGQERRDQYLWDSWRALHGHFFWVNLAWVGAVIGGRLFEEEIHWTGDRDDLFEARLLELSGRG